VNGLLTVLLSGAIGAAGGAALTLRRVMLANSDGAELTEPPRPAPPPQLAPRVPSPVPLPVPESDPEILPQFLRDMRDLWNADESIFWRWEEDRQVLVPDAWSTEGEPRPRFFDMIGWGPLVRWSAEEDRPHFGGDVSGSPMIAVAPVRSGRRLYGVLTVASTKGLALDREVARGWIVRFASQVASLVSLLERAEPPPLASAANDA
jgi:hypothetical protein